MLDGPAVDASDHPAVPLGADHLGAELPLDARLGREGVEQQALQVAAPDHPHARGGPRGASMSRLRPSTIAGESTARPCAAIAGPRPIDSSTARPFSARPMPAPTARGWATFSSKVTRAPAREEEGRGRAASGAADDEDVELREVHGEEDEARRRRPP
ncbi:hypothetical protein [Nannocystis pusilla]|uniref:hypothetical protein n=1 Tax=Nannocystis pusilla TaxID=889268 RepID=UPI003B80417B